MIQIAAQIRILVAVEAIDGRKGIDAIAQLCREKLNADPFSGYLFIFRSRRGTAIRILLPVKNLDFSTQGPYAIYNWEIFFHAPLLIAIHLSQNQQYQDAQNWFHYIFNPTDNSPGPTPERFWQVAPFQYTDVEMIQDILVNLSQKQDAQLYQQTVASINDWMQNPFQPWAVAQYRPTAYMLKTVMEIGRAHV